jgi:hypothetical protein
MPLFKSTAFDYSILRGVGLDHHFRTTVAPFALQHKNGYLRQFLIGAFAENTHSLSSQIAGTFPAYSTYFLLKAVPPIKRASTGA